MKDRIRTALNLLLQNTGDDWFIILEEPEHEKFVQFAYDEGPGLIFDLPFQALTDDEIEKAKKLMASFNIVPEELTAMDHPGGQKIGVQHSFSAQIGNDVELAVSLAYRVFREVYELADDTPFNVTIMR
ncbi:MAG: hypothetical protein EOM80_15405 [Erysipelotrichia bacterium]|nr:hypothetical protein [Erysipelotrichia bacterium]